MALRTPDTAMRTGRRISPSSAADESPSTQENSSMKVSRHATPSASSVLVAEVVSRLSALSASTSITVAESR